MYISQLLVILGLFLLILLCSIDRLFLFLLFFLIDTINSYQLHNLPCIVIPKLHSEQLFNGHTPEPIPNLMQFYFTCFITLAKILCDGIGGTVVQLFESGSGIVLQVAGLDETLYHGFCMDCFVFPESEAVTVENVGF